MKKSIGRTQLKEIFPVEQASACHPSGMQAEACSTGKPSTDCLTPHLLIRLRDLRTFVVGSLPSSVSSVVSSVSLWREVLRSGRDGSY